MQQPHRLTQKVNRACALTICSQCDTLTPGPEGDKRATGQTTNPPAASQERPSDSFSRSTNEFLPVFNPCATAWRALTSNCMQLLVNNRHPMQVLHTVMN
ncbi:hypothetical protein ILYODFUR_020814 [Ilyodon furcidens]|uniref:Uncharacterized protein n=1 Tax=Ilyodon furcidens TaxID=33524 RepID=A0ABV0UWK3_9TELE